jgi:aldose 1-epimerase
MPTPETGTSREPPSGEQFAIAFGHQQAVVTEVGATLRSYTVDDQNVVDGFPAEEICTAGRGQVLAPWPNRLGDGRYTFEGRSGRAALDEPERSNAIHGLVRWLPWALTSRAQNVLALGCTIRPQPGYPWRVSLNIEYRLGRNGLTVTTAVVNHDSVAAPFGLGFHPYLTVGTPTVDLARLTLPAQRRFVTDIRGLPIGDAPVNGTALDFAGGRPIGAIELDTAYTDLVRDDEGIARITLDGPVGGRGVTVWMDAHFPYVMAFTGDTLAPERRRHAIAIEPMTCAPDALRTGNDLIRLSPGVEWRATWGITPR